MCEDCRCSKAGSVNPDTCDNMTGQCTCKEGYEGENAVLSMTLTQSIIQPFRRDDLTEEEDSIISAEDDQTDKIED